MESWLTKSCARSSAADISSQGQILTRDFYNRRTEQVAIDLLGKILVVNPDGLNGPDGKGHGQTFARIVETEAYRADDPASHSCRGETRRNALMFGEPGFAYIYFIYGMYEMLNFVTEPKGQAGAVLIRAVEPLGGDSTIQQMRMRRPSARQSHLTNGPGRLCRAMGIRMDHKGQSLQGPVIHVRDDGFRSAAYMESPRVGIRVGTERYWRYFIDGNPHISPSPENKKARPLSFNSGSPNGLGGTLE